MRICHFLQKHYTLQTGDLDAFSAPQIAASQDVIDTYHIVTRGFESYAILFVGVPGQRGVFCAARVFREWVNRLLSC